MNTGAEFSALDARQRSDRDVNGDTVFFIGSVSKTFTTLLLQDMIERGEMKLDDPVAKYLPKSVKMPTHGGKEITLLHLATHTAGFPGNPDNMAAGMIGSSMKPTRSRKCMPFFPLTH